jgi:hypothetical protein
VATERQCDGEEDRQRLELDARVMEGVRELRCGGGRGAVRARGAMGFIYGARGHRGGVMAALWP